MTDAEVELVVSESIYMKLQAVNFFRSVKVIIVLGTNYIYDIFLLLHKNLNFSLS